MKTKIQNLFKSRRASLPLLVALAILGLAQSARAQFTYTDNGTITITGYTGSGGAVTIPATINGTNVTSIGAYAFFNGTSLTSITIANNVTNIGTFAFFGCTSLTNATIANPVVSIGDAAFEGCTKLTSVTISNSVTSIGDGAFSGCTSLTNVIIPNSVTSIGASVFYSCTKLTAIAVDAQNSFYSSVNGVLFDKNQTTLVEYPGGLTGNYTIPNSVTSIGDYAFENSRLANVTIGKSVISIGQDSFSYCALLTYVTISANLTSIGIEAFQGCTYLIGVYFSGNTPSYGFNAFNGDNYATAYYLPGTIGWTATFDILPTALWTLPYPLILTGNPGFGAQAGGFSFTVSWATNLSVVVEACTNLSSPVWQPLQTNALVNGTNYFSDGNWTNYPHRFYRVRGE